MFVSCMNRMSRFPIIILVITSMLLSACFAQTYPGNYVPPVDFSMYTVRAGSVAYGIQQCLAGKPGTEILIQGEQILFTWGYEFGARGMFGIDMKTKTVMNIAEVITKGGGLVNAKTSQDLVNWMKANGWQTITGAALAESVKVALTAAITQIASSPFLALYVILPLGEDGEFDPFTLPGFAPEVDS